jgi:Phospholipase_D-nuclease N-terminal/Short C-terminal domain
VLAADYPFLDVFWSMLVFFLWVMWIWLLFTIWGDIFRRDDISGWGKAAWLIFTIALPFLGVFVYLIGQHEGMTKRNVERVRADRAQFDDYVRETAGSGGSAAEIERAKQLLDSGAITQPEYELIKQKALA